MSHFHFEQCATAAEKGRKYGGSRKRLLPFVIAFLLVSAFRVSAQSPTQMEAAVLGNFAKFVQWPDATFPDTDAPIRLGILGEDPFGDDLQTILDSIKVRGRAFSVIRAAKSADLISCQIVFCALRDPDATRHAITIFAGRAILLVGEMPQFLELGGMLNLYLEDRKVRFAVNLDAVVRAGISINPQLLRLAATVKHSEKTK